MTSLGKIRDDLITQGYSRIGEARLQEGKLLLSLDEAVAGRYNPAKGLGIVDIFPEVDLELRLVPSSRSVEGAVVSYDVYRLPYTNLYAHGDRTEPPAGAAA